MVLSPNERDLVMAVLERGPVARQELLTELDISAPSLTRLSKRFVDLGVFTEIPNMDAFQDQSLAVGRPSKGYQLNPDHGRVIGVKLTGHNAYGVLTDLTGNLLGEAETHFDNSHPKTVVNAILQVTQELSPDNLLGLGVALGGQVSDQGVVERAPFLDWRNVDLKTLLQDRINTEATNTEATNTETIKAETTNIQVTVENDVVALAEGLRLFGVAREEPDFALITIGAGVGQALVVQNRVVRSAESGLGLGGHIPLDGTGPYCDLGYRGCSQAMLTIGSMTAQLEAALDKKLSYAQLLQQAEQGAPAPSAIVEGSARALGRMIATTANLSASNVVVLGGEGTGLWQVAKDQVVAEALRYRDPESLPLQILVDQAGFQSWALGAAASALLTYLRSL